MDQKYLIYSLFILLLVSIVIGYVYYKRLAVQLDIVQRDLITIKNFDKYTSKTGSNNIKAGDDVPVENNLCALHSNNTEHVHEHTHKETTGVPPVAANLEGGDLMHFMNEPEDTHENIELNSIEQTQQEVASLENKLANLDGILENSSYNSDESNTLLNVNTKETNRIDEILNNENTDNNIVSVELTKEEPITNDIIDTVNDLDIKNNSSEFDDLENVPNDNNSELQQLIQQESELAETIQTEPNISEIKETSSIDCLSELHQKTQNLSQSFNLNISSNGAFIPHSENSLDLNPEVQTGSDKKDIEFSVTYNKYTNKQLREICKHNGLIIGGSKQQLVSRLLDNHVYEDTFKTNDYINYSSN